VLADSPFMGFIPVQDLKEARTFYERTLGLRVVEDASFGLVVDADGTLLRITPTPQFTPQPFTIAGWRVRDIAEVVAGLAARGVPFLRYEGMDQDDLGIWEAPSGDRVAWFNDPDGNTLSLTAAARQ
jgi:catechol 2,3-dioxygenase-like lactoylglutathione lyase family enzyme